MSRPSFQSSTIHSTPPLLTIHYPISSKAVASLMATGPSSSCFPHGYQSLIQLLNLCICNLVSFLSPFSLSTLFSPFSLHTILVCLIFSPFWPLHWSPFMLGFLFILF
jgi:hypothetical protein